MNLPLNAPSSSTSPRKVSQPRNLRTEAVVLIVSPDVMHDATDCPVLAAAVVGCGYGPLLAMVVIPGSLRRGSAPPGRSPPISSNGKRSPLPFFRPRSREPDGPDGGSAAWKRAEYLRLEACFRFSARFIRGACRSFRCGGSYPLSSTKCRFRFTGHEGPFRSKKSTLSTFRVCLARMFLPRLRLLTGSTTEHGGWALPGSRH